MLSFPEAYELMTRGYERAAEERGISASGGS